MERVICLVIGYLVGAVFQAGYWYGRFNKIDIRQHGSGNAGTTNVMRTLGKKAGAITYLVDALKSVLTVFIIHLIFGTSHRDMELVLAIYGGLGVVLGHNFPFYLGFKGGKGVAATSGFALSLILFPNCWIFTLSGLITFIGGTLISKYVSFGSLLFTATFFIEMIVLGQLGLLGLGSSELIEIYIVTFIITVLSFIRHRENIVRLIHGNERKIGQKKTEQTE